MNTKINETVYTSPGVSLSENPDGKGYTVTGIGSFCGNELCIGICEDGLPVTVIADEAFERSGIERVVIGDSVHTVGAKAFIWCHRLASVTMRGVRRIEWLAFSKCIALTDLSLGEGLAFIAERAFEECTSLSRVVIPASVSEIGSHAFCGCPLDEATFLRTEGWRGDAIPNFADKKAVAYRLSNRNSYRMSAPVLKIRHASTDTSVLTSPDLELRLNADGEGYTVAGYGYLPLSATELSIGICEDGLPVTDIADTAFSAHGFREKIARVTIGGCVKHIGKDSFHGGKFESLTLEDGIETVGEGAFKYCHTIAGELIIPSSVTHIGEEAFGSCYGITAIVLPCPDEWELDGEPCNTKTPERIAELLAHDPFAKHMLERVIK